MGTFATTYSQGTTAIISSGGLNSNFSTIVGAINLLAFNGTRISGTASINPTVALGFLGRTISFGASPYTNWRVLAEGEVTWNEGTAAPTVLLSAIAGTFAGSNSIASLINSGGTASGTFVSALAEGGVRNLMGTAVSGTGLYRVRYEAEYANNSTVTFGLQGFQNSTVAIPVYGWLSVSATPK